jgi:hypothetical protein
MKLLGFTGSDNNSFSKAWKTLTRMAGSIEKLSLVLDSPNDKNDEDVISPEAAQEFAKTILNAPAISIVPKWILKQVTEAMELVPYTEEKIPHDARARRGKPIHHVALPHLWRIHMHMQPRAR